MRRVQGSLWVEESQSYGPFVEAVLLDNVQFIYELVLAKREIAALGASFELLDDLRTFRLREPSTALIEEIRRKSSFLKFVGSETTDYSRIVSANRTRSVNQYLTHWMYPYKGKFHPQMVRALINIIGLREGNTLLDPFSGSGTTALEAQLLGVNFIGYDISPVCVIQARVKTESIDVIDKIESMKSEVLTYASRLREDGRSYYRMLEHSCYDDRVKNFYVLARLLAISDSSRRGRNFAKSLEKNLEQMIASVKDYALLKQELDLHLGNVRIEMGDARMLDLANDSIDGIVTSPPYSIALDYVENDAHSLLDLGLDPLQLRENFIGVRGKGKRRVEMYDEDMKMCYSEMYRVLKPGRYAVIVIGNATYEGKEVKTVEFTIDFMEKLGFTLVERISKIIFGLYNVMKSESILIFRK